MNVIVGWIVGNTQSGPHSFRKKKPLGWQYSDGLVTQSYHEAEVARLRTELADAHAAIQSKAGWEWKKEADRLRAELQNAAKAALDAVALSCEKEREADALRAEVNGLAQSLTEAFEADQEQARKISELRTSLEKYQKAVRKIRARADSEGTAKQHGKQYVAGLRTAANMIDAAMGASA